MFQAAAGIDSALLLPTGVTVARKNTNIDPHCTNSNR